MARVKANGRALVTAYRTTARSIADQRAILPAAEWLVDNFHVVDEQLREIRDDLPSGFYRGLPKLANGPLQGYPRVLALVWSYIEHTDSLFDPESMRRFVRAYQSVQPLRIGELWAIPVWLRLLLVENLRRLADDIVQTRFDRERADSLADTFLGIVKVSQKQATDNLKLVRSGPISSPYAVELLQRLRDRESATTPALLALDERFSSMGKSRDEVVAREHQRQAANHVMVRNIITSMRTISGQDWPTFFEDISFVDEALRAGTTFSESDFPTRDRCRAAIEELGRGSNWSEIEVARLVAQHAAQARGSARDNQLAEPAYYLIAGGRKLIERELDYRVPLMHRLRRAYAAHATLAYVSTIILLTSAILAAPLIPAGLVGTATTTLVILGLLGLIPASDSAIAIVNASASDMVGARHLPRLSLEDGIPTSLRTLVAIPALLTDETEVRELLESIEVHFLANRDGDIYFAIVSDWVDAPTPSLPLDEPLFAQAAAGIAELNARYGSPRFFLFHRRRVFNDADGIYMGWERKRGKLHELNRLLRGAKDTSFVALNGQAPPYPDCVRYVITLDADTQMPQRTALQLVGTAAHPLNRPIFDPVSGRIISGHAILQPRITPSLPFASEDTLFQRVYSGHQGTDPYAFVVFDVYQDLFGEGIYTGKGIYELDSFERALGGKFPDNSILSHDLIEGIVARAGFVSDIELFETYPPHYEIAARRDHRWTRGDWQLLPWLFGRGGKVGRTHIAVPGIGRWKLLDNLRRSLSAPAALATLIAGWLLSDRLSQTWTTFVLATIAIPRGFAVLSGVVPPRPNIAKRTHLLALLSDIEKAVWQTVLDVTFLAHRAYQSLDAIARTLARLLITRRRMLEWTTAAQSRLGIDLDLGRTFIRMYPAVLVATLTNIALATLSPSDAWTWAPLTVLWMISPAIARASSIPRGLSYREVLSRDQQQLFCKVARKTWRYFETFVTENDHDLPPDNFQVEPHPIVAHRTSPTNIGLYLLSVVAAYDFGWIAPSALLTRLTGTLNTLSRLERWHGHFYNWYDTEKLVPLEPKYVSTVDSGNLVGDLITVAQSCQQFLHASFLQTRCYRGLEVHLPLISDSLMLHCRGDSASRAQTDAALQKLSLLCAEQPDRVTAVRAHYLQAAQISASIIEALNREDSDSRVSEAENWARAIQDLAVEQLKCIDQAYPWVVLLDQSKGHALEVLEGLDKAPPCPADASSHYTRVLADLGGFAQQPGADEQGIGRLVEACVAARRAHAAFAEKLGDIYLQCQRLTSSTDFSVLYDSSKKLFSIGCRLTDGRLDTSYYDLLASEARLASYVAIAKGDVPANHWQKLGRPLTPAGKGSALLSWSGSMFEYLMPELIMRDPKGSLLDQTACLVVERQKEYAKERGVPWGISESAYNARDASLNYQYSSFGVNGLGLKRGLAQNLVIAPYATALAALVAPVSSAINMERLAQLKADGEYGFYEAVDFTPARLEADQRYAIVRAYFAHHQGMTLVALANVLQDERMRSRFHSDFTVRSAELLLQERTPRSVAVATPRADEAVTDLRTRDIIAPALRTFQSPHQARPRTHVLSNGKYAVMLTAAGAGYSRWGEVGITRWREDALRSSVGVFIYVRDTNSGRFWSAGYQPCLVEPEAYNVVYSEDRVEIQRQDRSINTTTEIVVSPEDEAEARQISLHNKDTIEHVLEVTSYVELALAAQAADEAHPVFSSLFVQTEYVAEVGALLATRRTQPSEPGIWVAHVAAVQGETVGEVEYETSRAHFIGRGGSLRSPRCVALGEPLSGETGTVLSSVLAIRYRLKVAAGATARVSYTLLACESRDVAIQAAQRYRVATAFERTATLAWTHAQVKLRHHEIDAEEAHVFQRLAGYLIYRSPGGESRNLSMDEQFSSAMLWAHGISGDLPILVLRIDDEHDRDVVRQLLRAHQYWQSKVLEIDIVILNECPPSYEHNLENSIDAMIRAWRARMPESAEKTHGNVIAVRGDLMSPRERRNLLVTARIILSAHGGSLADYVVRRMRAEPAPRIPLRPPRTSSVKLASSERPELELDNGLGGFSRNGREYVIVMNDGDMTPAPWTNVIANEEFGFQVTELGGGYTWSENSRENQLTGWTNDAVVDPQNEVLYVRDDQTGEVWSATPSPIRERAAYVVRHGFGYTAFEHDSHEISLALTQLVALDDPIKISSLTLANRSRRARRISVAAYAEWVLGASRRRTEGFIVTSGDNTGTIYARNVGNPEFAERTAFASLSGARSVWTCDRVEFLGLHGDLSRPSGLAPGVVLSKRAGGGLDPCAALLTTLTLAPGAKIEVRFLLGQAADATNARILVEKYLAQDTTKYLEIVRDYWDDTLKVIQVRTPDREFDVLANGWLLYQTLCCRMWARAGFYQAGGAYGFRDQLQDSMALTLVRPDVSRAQLLRAASRQFIEGDVQHWWHPPSGRGVRTRVSDDRAWLAYSTCHYIDVTGDDPVLDDAIPFIEGPQLVSGQEDAYFTPTVSSECGSLYEHCARALDASLALGPHGLPLMGTGDWNDGMNWVGREGVGESVWLGWLLCATLEKFAVIARKRGDSERSTKWQSARETLVQSLEREAWDGAWYRRAFFDDGAPLGSNSNIECRIDSIAQSWAVLSQAAQPDRIQEAMGALERELVQRNDNLVLLLTPPFDRAIPSPGYIANYPPGIRENGGQYTHAAIWAVIAFAQLGDGNRAYELLKMIHPMRHSRRDGVRRYGVEPYVVAADIYSNRQHVGQGGWTWYTGSAGWMYRACIESIMGLQLKGNSITIKPCVPSVWDHVELTYKYRSSFYKFGIDNSIRASYSTADVWLDDSPVDFGEPIELKDDEMTHEVRVVLK